MKQQELPVVMRTERDDNVRILSARRASRNEISTYEKSRMSPRLFRMPVIRLLTLIDAPVGRVFDLARSIDAHVASTGGTAERAVAGVTSGLIEAGQSVTWEARHFGVKQHLTVRITKMSRPEFFEDEMVSGAFKRMQHRHEFVFRDGRTEMIDVFDFAAPLGVLGRVAESLFLRGYMERFLRLRAARLKRIAESDEWREFVADG